MSHPARAQSVGGRPLRTRVWTAPARTFPAWKIPSYSGAVATASSAGTRACAAGQLTARYWTSWPAMTTDVSGVNVTNASRTACELPRFPGNITLTQAAGSAVAAARLLSGSGRFSSSDFVRFGSAGTATVTGSQTERQAATAGLTLRPGGTAVVTLDTFTPPAAQNGGLRCISTPRGGALRVSIPGRGALTVRMPAGSWSTPSAVDPTGAAFASCGTVVVSPFLSWRQAVAIVGVPVPEAPGYGALPLAHTAQYKAAP
jgi:hypothetical protein